MICIFKKNLLKISFENEDDLLHFLLLRRYIAEKMKQLHLHDNPPFFRRKKVLNKASVENP